MSHEPHDAPAARPTGSNWIQSALDRHEKPLVAYATRLLGDVHRARDVVQDTFLRLLAADRATVEPVLPRWLFTVCRNRAFDERRRRARHARLDDGLDGRAAPDAGVEGPAEAAEDARRARSALEALPAHLAEVLVLRLSCGLSYADIGEVTGLSTSHVGVKVHEGMKALRVRLGVAPSARASSGEPR